MSDYLPREDKAFYPARKIIVVTPSADPIDPPLRGLRAAGDGTVTLRAIDNDTPVEHPVVDGERIDAIITHVTAADGVTLIGYQGRS